MIRWGVGRCAAALVVVGVMGLVSGCSPAGPPARPTPTSPAPDPVSIEQQLPNLLVAGQTIGTGELRVVDHEPIPGPASEHPLTGAVRVVVGADHGVEVHIRPDDPATVDLTVLDLVMTGKRHDGGAENIQAEDAFGLVPKPKAADTGGELVFLMPLDSPSAGDPTFLHSLEESPSGDARLLAVAELTWTLPSAYPALKVADRGTETNARGRTVLDGGTPAYYVPSTDDTIYQVSRRFGISETQLVWLNPELLMGSPDPQLKTGIGVNLDPSRR
ncbi:hypothetical protein [Leifsonia aquatica]|uniref:hypothetical protein n=1 Tax=Leifsonia aquatica TaxID=144185 RepID=UPI00046A1256|nr:hypothetical protein [Leifsonia aquatica]